MKPPPAVYIASAWCGVSYMFLTYGMIASANLASLVAIATAWFWPGRQPSEVK
jgi:hypothetical protein